MSSGYVCSTCRQVLKLRLRQAPQNQAISRERISTSAHRLLSTARILQAAQAKAYQKPSSGSAAKARTSSTPTTYPKTPEPSPGSSFSPAQSIARELRKRAGPTTETYIAYGVCEKLVKECARVANYRIPQAQQKNTDIPKTKDGEDLGVGDGWWYGSKFCSRQVSNGNADCWLSIISPRPHADIHQLGSCNLFTHVHAHLPAPHVSSSIRAHLAPAST